MAVGLVILFLEGSLIQMLKAKRANEMLWMKFAKHCSNTATRNGFMASSTQGAPFRVVMRLTVGLSFMVKE